MIPNDTLLKSFCNKPTKRNLLTIRIECFYSNMQRRGILFLLLVVGVAVSTAQTPTGDNDETNDGFNETKCVKMIEKARARFDENKDSIEQFMTQYLCNSIGPKKVRIYLFVSFLFIG